MKHILLILGIIGSTGFIYTLLVGIGIMVFTPDMLIHWTEMYILAPFMVGICLGGIVIFGLLLWEMFEVPRLYKRLYKDTWG